MYACGTPNEEKIFRSCWGGGAIKTCYSKVNLENVRRPLKIRQVKYILRSRRCSLTTADWIAIAASVLKIHAANTGCECTIGSTESCSSSLSVQRKHWYGQKYPCWCRKVLTDRNIYVNVGKGLNRGDISLSLWPILKRAEIYVSM